MKMDCQGSQEETNFADKKVIIFLFLLPLILTRKGRKERRMIKEHDIRIDKISIKTTNYGKMPYGSVSFTNYGKIPYGLLAERSQDHISYSSACKLTFYGKMPQGSVSFINHKHDTTVWRYGSVGQSFLLNVLCVDRGRRMAELQAENVLSFLFVCFFWNLAFG